VTKNFTFTAVGFESAVPGRVDILVAEILSRMAVLPATRLINPQQVTGATQRQVPVASHCHVG